MTTGTSTCCTCRDRAESLVSFYANVSLSILQGFDLFCYGIGHGNFHGHGHGLIVKFIVIVMVIVFFCLSSSCVQCSQSLNSTVIP